MNTLRHQSKLSRYVRIAEELREQIESTALKPGDKLASFTEMRTKFGVSQGVLERAYSLLEQDGLIVRRSGNGTFVARREPQALHNALGCLVPAVSLPYFSHLLEGIREVAHREGQHVTLMRDALPASCQRLDGILLYGAVGQWMPALPGGLPHVTLMTGNDEYPSVEADDFGGARQAVEHLISLGHRRIAYLLDLSGGEPILLNRLAGYRAALHDAGIAAEKRWVRNLADYGPFLRRGGFNMYDWLRADWRELGCTALLVQNDLAAIGAIGQLQQADIRVPEDVSVVGFDSTDECEIVRPNLSSVHVPLREIGAASAELLLKMVRGEAAPAGPVLLPTRMDVRDSTAINVAKVGDL